MFSRKYYSVKKQGLEQCIRDAIFCVKKYIHIDLHLFFAKRNTDDINQKLRKQHAGDMNPKDL